MFFTTLQSQSLLYKIELTNFLVLAGGDILFNKRKACGIVVAVVVRGVLANKVMLSLALARDGLSKTGQTKMSNLVF